MVRTQSALGHEGQPEDVANVVAFLLSEGSRYITGQTVSSSHPWFVKALSFFAPFRFPLMAGCI